MAVVGLVASCGGRAPRGVAPKAFATGPIYEACLRADRKEASSARCGCVQAVANVSLHDNDRARAVKFFADPQKAQDTRQSDSPALEAFWKRYKGFAAQAENTCV